MTSSDMSQGGRSGLDLYATRDGIVFGGWYDTMVGIEPMFVTWEQIDALRKKAKRRQPYAQMASEGAAS